MADIREDELRREYLAEQDAPCPRCGYNLRGSSAKACPECGFELRLVIAGYAGKSVPALFAYIVFGWAFFAAAMNSVRNGLSLYQQASMLSMRQLYLGGNVNVRGFSVQGMGREFSWEALMALPPSAWVDPAWAFVCLMLATMGLVIVRRSLLTPTPLWRNARLAALALYALYGGYHLFMFVQQVLGW